MVGEENWDGSWRRWKKNLGEGCERCQIIHLSLTTLSNRSNHNHTPPLNFFFIFVRTRQKYFLCDFYWGPNSKIYKVAKTSVKGFLGKCLKLYKKGDTIEFSRTKHRWHYLHNINLHFLTVFHPKPPPPFVLFHTVVIEHNTMN